MHNAETMVNTLTNVKCNLPVMVSHLKVSSNEVYLNYADIFSHFALELPEWGYQILILHKLSLDFFVF